MLKLEVILFLEQVDWRINSFRSANKKLVYEAEILGCKIKKY